MAWLGHGEWKNERLIIVKPTTYVNASGRAVRAVMDYYGVQLRDLLVVVDDVNLRVGDDSDPASRRLRRPSWPGIGDPTHLELTDFCPVFELALEAESWMDLTAHVLSGSPGKKQLGISRSSPG